jgi:RNA polymerase sigma-70 factor (ECF subfamily)
LALAEITPNPAITAAEVFRQHAPFVWRSLRALGVAQADVADVCQEVFVTVHRKLPTFEGRSTLRTWLYGICTRTASDYRRRAPRRREVLTDDPPDEGTNGGADEAVALRQARRLLNRILDELTEEQRAVFVLYEIEELSMSDVAEALGCPLQTAYSRLSAARRHVEIRATALGSEARTPSRSRPSDDGRRP